MAGHERDSAVAGKIPPAAKKVPTYETPGRLRGSVLESRTAYPMTAKRADPAMNKARWLSRSEMVATLRVVMKAKAYGGTVSNWDIAGG